MSGMSEILTEDLELDRSERGCLERVVAQWSIFGSLLRANCYLVAKANNSWCTVAVRSLGSGTEFVSLDPVDGRWGDLDAVSETSGEAVDGDPQVRRFGVTYRGKLIAAIIAESLSGSEMNNECASVDRSQEISKALADLLDSGALPHDDKDGYAWETALGLIVDSNMSSAEFASQSAPRWLLAEKDVSSEGRFSLDTLGFVTADFVVKETRETQMYMNIPGILRLVLFPKSEDSDFRLAALCVEARLSELSRGGISMETTIKEIHHRVKNNLQTVSSILQLQVRRVEEASAVAAIEDSVRRIASIAVVHELLARNGVEPVALEEIVHPIISLTRAALVHPERPVDITFDGHGPALPETLVTSVAVVLTELLQNALIHGFPEGSDGGNIEIHLEFSDPVMTISVADDGVGVPDGFNLAAQSGLGLTIVQTLVEGDLRGDMTMGSRSDGKRGTQSVVTADLQKAAY